MPTTVNVLDMFPHITPVWQSIFQFYLQEDGQIIPIPHRLWATYSHADLEDISLRFAVLVTQGLRRALGLGSQPLRVGGHLHSRPDFPTPP